MLRLDITDSKGSRLLETDETMVTLGRSRKCTIRIRDKQLSRMHCVLRLETDGWHLKDVGRNKTYVNDREAKECRIRSGDKISSGRSTIVVMTDESVVAPPVSGPPTADQPAVAVAAPRAKSKHWIPWTVAGSILGVILILIILLYGQPEDYRFTIAGYTIQRGTTQELNRKVGLIVIAVGAFHLALFGVAFFTRGQSHQRSVRVVKR